MVKIKVISDLHLEFYRQMDYHVDFTGEDVLVLAGDIQCGYKFKLWMADLLKDRDVVYVMGNHEFYHGDMQEMYRELQSYADSVNAQARSRGWNYSFYALQNSHVDMYGVRFAGATLWTDYAGGSSFHMGYSEGRMNDYRLISNGGSRLAPQDLLDEHNKTVIYLNQVIDDADRPVVVVTHHAPSYQSVHPMYAGDPLNSSFASNLDNLVSRVPLWIHGHMHQAMDYTLNPTNNMGRVICNPRGYVSMGETNKFDPNLIIEI